MTFAAAWKEDTEKKEAIAARTLAVVRAAMAKDAGEAVVKKAVEVIAENIARPAAAFQCRLLGQSLCASD